MKWGKETYTDVEVDMSESPEVFRAQVFALTGVQPTRQKLLLKGTTIKQDSWDGAPLRNVRIFFNFSFAFKINIMDVIFYSIISFINSFQ